MLRITANPYKCGISAHIKCKFIALITLDGRCRLFTGKRGDPRKFYVVFKRDIRERGKRYVFRVGYQNLFHKNSMVRELCLDDSYITRQRKTQFMEYMLWSLRNHELEMDRMF